MYRIHQIKLNIGEPKDKIPRLILKKLGAKGVEIKSYSIVRESIDARDKSKLMWVYTVDFYLCREGKPDSIIELSGKPLSRVEVTPDTKYRFPEPGEAPIQNRPVVVGFGPCGMFAGLILAQAGYKPIVIDRGQSVDNRMKTVKEFWKNGTLNIDSNVQFGEGGAGTFSDGKLTTGIKDVRIRKVLEEMVFAGADRDILYKQKPHIGTDILQVVVKNIRQRIIALGGQVLFNTRLERIHWEENRDNGEQEVTAVTATNVETGERLGIKTENLILAIGHSARDTFRILNEDGIPMTPKPFSIGVRIEHPQDVIDVAQYGKTSGELGLPVADYKLSYHCKDGRGVYTFCMCPGGEVICAASQEKGVVTNGMSYHLRNSGTANSALLCDVRVEDFGKEGFGGPLAGVEFQEKYERLAFVNGGGNYGMPKTRWEHFCNNDEEAKNVTNSLPEFAVKAIIEAMPNMGRKLKGFDDPAALMTAVETRSSSPVRFFRDGNMQSTIKGLYPCGEGAGYAGGIVSAACDGIKVAEKIIEKYRPIGERA